MDKVNRAADSAKHQVNAAEHGIKETGHQANADAHWEAAKNPNLPAGDRAGHAMTAAGEKINQGKEAVGRKFEEARS